MAGQQVLQRRLEPWRWEAQCLVISSWPWPTERITEADPLATNYMRSCPRAQYWLFYGPFCIWNKLERWKSSISGSLVSWPQIKKIIILKCHLLLFYTTTTNHFSIRLWHAMESGFYTTACDNQLSGWPEKQLQSTSQSQTCTKKKVIVTVWWSAAHLIHYSFLNPGGTITSEKHAQQTDEMHWKLQRLQPVLVNIMGPVLRDNAWPQVWQTVFQKFNELGYKVSPHLPYSPDLSPTTYHFKHLKNFLQRKCLQSQEAENAFQQFTESWSIDFYAAEINKPISSWKKCVGCNSSYFD